MWKEKIKSKSFWISLGGTLIVLLQAFGIKADAPYINEIINAVCSVLIVSGIISEPNAKADKLNKLDEGIKTSDEAADISFKDDNIE